MRGVARTTTLDSVIDDADQRGTAARSGDIDFADLVRVLHQGVWVIDLDGITLYANQRMADLLQTTPEAMIDGSVLEYFFEHDHALLLEQIATRHRGASDDYVARLRRTDGELVVVRVHASPLRRDGVVFASVAAMSDITELTADAADNTVALHDAEESLRRRTRLMSWVAHELRTPLNTIAGFAQLLRTSSLPPRDLDRVNNILAASTHMDGLVQDLLDYARADSATIEARLQAVAVADAVAEAVSLVAGVAQQQQVHIDRNVPDLWVIADHRKLVGVLVNLLSNAVKYGGSGNVVTVSASAVSGRVECTVADQGPGITLRHQRAIFQPFERLDNAEGMHGTGLGLAIVDAYVRAMHGTISLESVPGQGTTFTVDLPPAQRPDPEPAPPDARPAHQEAGENVRTVLYVEDEPLNASLLESIVSLLPGRRLHVEPTVAGGIAAASSIRPALVLLDLNLPDGSGFDVLRSIRSNPDLAATPVFILSADATEQATQRAQELGADRFISKPFDLEQFLSLLDHHTK